MEISPFRIEVPDADLADLRERLARTRFPAEMPGSGWGYGTDVAYLRELVGYWRDRFDWRAQEAAFNRLPQFKAKVGGLGIHLVHVRGKGPKPLPLVITHGWPGSVFEFTKIIGPLTDPASHGGDPADAFDVVCPSMPGYGFSDPAVEPGMDPEKIASLWVELMHGLGYRRFGAQGGDWGSMVTTYLGFRHPESLVGIHLNMVVAFPPNPANPLEGAEESDMAGLMETAQFLKDETGYQQIQGTKPQTIDIALNDSPVGLAAWIVEKFKTWCDCDGNPENVFTKEELLTNISLYWLTQTAGSSARIYYESRHAPPNPNAGKRIEVPTACADFPKEIIWSPRKWLEGRYNIVRWTEMPKGGHFAAFEQPQLL
ncbi:MAG: epoxide hydrolase family protein, partial [Alphaproteobacteria bacterium]